MLILFSMLPLRRSRRHESPHDSSEAGPCSPLFSDPNSAKHTCLDGVGVPFSEFVTSIYAAETHGESQLSPVWPTHAGGRDADSDGLQDATGESPIQRRHSLAEATALVSELCDVRILLRSDLAAPTRSIVRVIDAARGLAWDPAARLQQRYAAPAHSEGAGCAHASFSATANADADTDTDSGACLSSASLRALTLRAQAMRRPQPWRWGAGRLAARVQIQRNLDARLSEPAYLDEVSQLPRPRLLLYSSCPSLLPDQTLPSLPLNSPPLPPSSLSFFPGPSGCIHRVGSIHSALLCHRQR